MAKSNLRDMVIGGSGDPYAQNLYIRQHGG